jgi:transglutaminase-like putative cysteine protease
MQNQENLLPYLNESKNIDFKSEAFIEFMKKGNLSGNSKEKALQWYLFVRDAFLYDPYHLDLRSSSLTVSHIVSKKRAWCVEKALVFTAGCRAMGIPARLGFGIVQNHLGADQLEHYLKRKEIVFHGYAEVFLNGKWVKCTPAFDRRICAINKIEPLNWNGEDDSLFQAFSGDNKFMEYLHFYGEFAEIPFELMHTEMEKHYPHLFTDPINTKAFSFRF